MTLPRWTAEEREWARELRACDYWLAEVAGYLAHRFPREDGALSVREIRDMLAGATGDTAVGQGARGTDAQEGVR
jgi:hypothetical protein